MNPCLIPPVVLFDLDGTLVDTAPDLHAAMNRMLDDAGRAPVALEGFRRVVSRGGLAMLEHAFPDLPETERAALLAPYLDRYGRETTRLSRPFDGVEPLLAAIEASGARWGIVTNKPGWLTTPLLARLDLAARATCVISGDSTARAKPFPDPLLAAASALGIAPADCLYVGDAERDV
ncbi:MAG TPA: phosphoglycolate phosphatase, partial [Xanthomonadales bacterium]|nr:phosphoglycolate phosphatase [Xanthomonadales bacterium]